MGSQVRPAASDPGRPRHAVPRYRQMRPPRASPLARQKLGRSLHPVDLVQGKTAPHHKAVFLPPPGKSAQKRGQQAMPAGPASRRPEARPSSLKCKSSGHHRSKPPHLMGIAARYPRMLRPRPRRSVNLHALTAAARTRPAPPACSPASRASPRASPAATRPWPPPRHGCAGAPRRPYRPRCAPIC